MRYTTPLWVRPKGYYNSDGNYVRTGSCEEVGVPVPNPGQVPPKPGHWRLTPGGKMRMAPRKGQAGPIWASSQPQPFRPHTQDNPTAMGTRARVRAAVAAGIIAPADAPSWAQ